MKISFDGSIDKLNNELIQKDLKRVKNAPKKTDNYASEDSVEISSKAIDFKTLQAKAMEAPDVRMEKINEIKTRVDSGTYEISHEKIAERMIEENLTG